VTGTKIGAIQLTHEPEHTWTANETELIQATAVQLAQHIENLRLMAEAEKYRAEAEDAVRRLTREGWDEYLQADGKETAGFAYDLNEVHPLSERGNSYPSETTRPLAVRNEIVGELSINTGEGSQAGANELLSAVASQLSAHIENLRLSLSNMSLLKSTEARAQREQTLRQITSALRSSTNPATIMQTAVRELGNILGRKTVVQLLTPERTDQAASTVQDANDSDIPAN
jgi:GAF domain-containing protein